MAVTEAVRPLMERRFALLDVVQLLGGLAETVSLLGCLVLGVLLFLAKPLPPVRRGILFFLTLTAGLLLLTVPFAALDGVYQIVDYLLPSLNILLPAAVLLGWWSILALVQRKKPGMTKKSWTSKRAAPLFKGRHAVVFHLCQVQARLSASARAGMSSSRREP